MAAPQGTFVVFLLLAVTFSSSNPISTITASEKIVDADYRLKNVVEPLHYDLDLTIADDFVNTKLFKGLVKIRLQLKEQEVEEMAKDKITLHMKDLALTNTEILLYAEDDEQPQKTNLLDTSRAPVPETTLEMVTFTIKNQLAEDKRYILQIPYTGTLHEDMYGFYLSSYEENGNTEYLATTQFQPTHARRAFPCFDEPNLKATFKITIVHPDTYHALSNTQRQSDSSGTGGTKTTFAETPKMSTYLVAFIVSKFSSITDTLSNSVFAQKQLIDTAEYALDISPKVLDAMKEFTGVDYKVPGITKLDQAAIPDFSAGAMENWGLATYRETALLWDSKESTARSKQQVATIVAHELSHMWFGDLVTCDWWSSTWLNEGFATYFQYHATAKVETDWELEYQFVIEQHQPVLNSDSLTSAQALTSPAFSPAQISSKFGSISYNKGGSVIRMMEKFLGSDIFLKGIKEYLKENGGHHFKNVKPENLWAAMSTNVASGQLPTRLATLMKPWTDHAGFPVVTVSASEDKVSFKAERFLFHKVEGEDTTNIWYIPISYTTASTKEEFDTTPKKWIKPTDEQVEADLKLNDDWIVVNIQSSAYIRVNYEPALWKKLENALEKNHEDIHVLNRAQIADDALNLARAGIIKYNEALDVLQYLEKETDYYPWYSAFNAFAYLKRRIDSESELATYLNKHITNLMQKLYQSVSFESTLDKQIDIYRQTLALKWACDLDNEECIKKSDQLFESLKNNNGVNPDLRSTVYCTAIRNSKDRNNWDFLWERLTQTKVASEVATIITALGCSKDEDILKDYLDESIKDGSEIRKQDAHSVFTAVISGNAIGVQTGLDFLILKFKEIRDHYGGMNALTTVITSLADRLTTKTQLATFEKFVEENKSDLGAAAEAAESAIQSIEQNFEWVDSFSDDLLAYLKETTSPSSSSSESSNSDPTTTEVITTTQGSASITASFTVVLLSILLFINN